MSSHSLQLSFIKGMTLQQYMAGLTFNQHSPSVQKQYKSEQNLYELSLATSQEHSQLYIRNTSMQLIHEESQDEVGDSIQPQAKKSQLPEQLTKATFKQTIQDTPQKRKSVHFSRKMNSTAYFGSDGQEKSFRIKHVSNSPAKKTKQSLAMATNSMTLYRVKFNNTNQKQSGKMNQLMTFYGKKRLETKEDKKGEGRTSIKNMTKKCALDLCGLQGENRSKHRAVSRISLPEMKIQGLRDKIVERKNKFC